MSIPNRAENAENWEFDKLVTILLRQFKRLLEQKGVELTDQEMRQIGEQVAKRETPDPRLPAIREALAELVQESLDVLGAWGLSFAQSLETTMSDMANWETTADFLDVANEKINAEVRISAGAALMTALGDPRYTPYLIQAMAYDLREQGRLDVDAVIGKKALCFAAGVDEDADDWLTQLRGWVR